METTFLLVIFISLKIISFISILIIIIIMIMMTMISIRADVPLGDFPMWGGQWSRRRHSRDHTLRFQHFSIIVNINININIPTGLAKHTRYFTFGFIQLLLIAPTILSNSEKTSHFLFVLTLQTYVFNSIFCEILVHKKTF